ncbi:MAG: hypothetical protein II890_03535 [Spirochaetia bacterium]|nr:hypothetical protein [Spirochaetia bacterium]
MKKYYQFLIVVICFIALSCDGGGSGGGDSNAAPEIKELEFRSDPFSETVPASFNVGDDIWLTFVVSDKDKDIQSYFLTIKDASTLTIIMDETEYQLEQADVTEFFYTPVDSSISGTFRYEFYIKDKAGNTSNILSKNLIIN